MAHAAHTTPPRRPKALMKAAIRRGREVRERVVHLPAVTRSVRAALLLASSLRSEPLALRAAALTYLTLLAIVPLLAVVFSIFQAVVGTDELQAQLQAFILKNLAVGTAEDFATYIQEHVHKASGAALGGIGFAFLLASSISLLANMEKAFNATFQAPRPRPLALRIGIYWSLLTLGPLLLSLSIAGTALLQSQSFVFLGATRKVILTLLPYLVTYGTFMLLYMIVPAVVVKRRAAMIGAVVAGTVWEIAKIAYASSLSSIVRKDAVYGSLSAIPVFLLWVYVSWVIVLFGARVAYAAQTSHVTLDGETLGSPLGRELLAARVMRSLAREFQYGRSAPDVADLSEELHVAEPEIRGVLTLLSEHDVVRELAEGGWIPARPPKEISLGDVRHAARGEIVPTGPVEPEFADLLDRWQAADEAADCALSITYDELAMEAESPGQTGPLRAAQG